MKTGILGGTFDPIHRGHIHIAEAALSEYGLDRIVFMPAGDPYFKKSMDVTSPALRYEMTSLAAAALGEPYECSDLEINDTQRSYTARTLTKFRRLCPSDSLYFIMGLDSLMLLGTWYEPQRILESAVLLIASRGSSSFPDDAFAAMEKVREEFADANPDIRLIHTPELDISSTLIRNKRAAGEEISQYLTPEVYDYIIRHDLYTSK